MDISYRVSIDKSFDEALNSLRNSLKNRGYGILWELDIQETLRSKGQDFSGNIKVLEVCNPGHAKVILDINMEAGLFLPCKMAVYEKDEKIFLGLIKPKALMEVFNDSKLLAIGEIIEEELKAAIEDTNKN